MNQTIHAVAASGRPAVVEAPVALDRLLLRMLDELDYGMLLVDRGGHLHYSNAPGRQELAGDGPMRLVDGVVVCLDPSQRDALQSAFDKAVGGRRQLLELKTGGTTRLVAFAPMSDAERFDERGCADHALVVFDKRPACSELAVSLFAGVHGLTGTESAVLTHLSRGLEPSAIAKQQGVALSTIRTQIASVRAKTRADSVRALLDRLALLPPVKPALRAVGIGMSRPGHAV